MLLVYYNYLWWSIDGVLLISSSFIVLFLASWIFNRDLATRFLSKLKRSNQKFVRVVFRDTGMGIQEAGGSFGIWGGWIIFLNLSGIIYWYGRSIMGWISQIYVGNSFWYYLVGLLSLVSIIWGIFKMRVSFIATHGELIGVLALLIVSFCCYLVAGNLFLLVFILEIQGILLIYFIAQLQLVGRSSSLGRWWVFRERRVKQRQGWQLAGLFIQFWSSFVGAIVLIFAGLQVIQSSGVIDWFFLQFWGGLKGCQGSFQMFVCLIVLGIAIKIGLFPFYFWKPDIYKNIAGWGMMVYVTIYTFALVMLSITIFRSYLGEFAGYWKIILFYLCGGGFIFVSNALFTITEIKPFLAYMSVIHMLYIWGSLVGEEIKGGFLGVFYLYIYVFNMLHFFGTYLSIKSQKFIFLTDLQQLPRIPLIMGSMSCALVAMSGLPPFLGFWGKIGVIFHLFMSREYTLGLIGLSAGLFLLYFYFQNYRFIGILQSGLLYKVVGVEYRSILIFIVIGSGMLLNVGFGFIILDLYGWSYLSAGWEILL